MKVRYSKDGHQHRYYPDFYLPKYGIYLDPKNPYCITQQQEKLNKVSKQIKLIYGDPNLIIEHIISTYSLTE